MKVWFKNYVLFVLGVVLSNTNLFGVPPNSEVSYEVKMLSIAKIAGIVYYFNPCKCRKKVSEEKIIMSLIQAGNKSKNDEDFIFNVNLLLSEFSCGASLKLRGQAIPQIEKGTGKYRYWKHVGPGTLSMYPPYVSDLMKLERDSFQYYKDLPQPDSLYSFNITETIDIFLPIAVSKAQYNMSSKLDLVKVKKTNKHALNLLDYRITNIIIAYNVLQHFQPYPEFNSIPIDSAFVHAIHKTRKDSSRTDFLRTIQLFFANINDSHCSSVDLLNRRNYFIPLYFSNCDEKIILKECFDEMCGEMLAGDIIMKIDNVPIEDLMKYQMEQTSSNTHARRIRRSASLIGLSTNNNPVKITYLNANNEEKDHIMNKAKISLFNMKYVNSSGKTITVSRKKYTASMISKNNFKEIDTGIYYIDVAGLSRRSIRTNFDDLKDAKGLVLDFRSYPEYVSYKLWGYFSDKPLISPQWVYDNFCFPFHENVNVDTFGYNWKPVENNLGEIPKVFIIGPSTISYGETVLYMYKKNESGLIIGQPTAACNGNKRTVKLPCKIIFEFTGMRVLNHDNTVYQGTGIQPDIFVNQTVDGIRNQQDEFLNEALKALKANLGK
jgi:hypothetical protein